MKDFDTATVDYDDNRLKNMYSFLATNYDISDLANKIYAAKYLKINTLSLKKGGTA